MGHRTEKFLSRTKCFRRITIISKCELIQYTTNTSSATTYLAMQINCFALAYDYFLIR